MRRRLTPAGHHSLRLAGRTGLLFAVAALSPLPAFGQANPAPAAKASLARYFPRKDLVVYAEFDGIDKHREAWKTTALFRLLNETTTGALYEQSLDRILDLVRTQQLKINVNGRDLHAILSHMLRSGFAVGINRAGGAGPPRSFAVVIRGAGAGAIRNIVARLPRSGRGPHALTQHVTKSGRQIEDDFLRSPFEVGSRKSPFEVGPRKARGLPPPVDAELIPDPDTLQPYLFPSVYMLAVNQEGIHIVSREAVPTLSPAMAVPIGLAVFLPAVTQSPVARVRTGVTEDSLERTTE